VKYVLGEGDASRRWMSSIVAVDGGVEEWFGMGLEIGESFGS
jgi:hypothetical protein